MEFQQPLQMIMRTVCAFRNISEQDLKSASKKQNIADARSEAVWIAKQLTHHSLLSIGRHIGGRDARTCHAAQNRIERRRGETQEYADELDQLLSLARQAVDGATGCSNIATPFDIAQRLLVPSANEPGLKYRELRILAQAYVQADTELTKFRTAAQRARSSLDSIAGGTAQ
ncbi:helix-turn-helix domain-containing protein [Halocynthiibacter styelae]|uniref:Chromosomal replication initiator DnaA C-terminal domain-containing protein n=1 Tax=Halocynthiibacter styelae TaxID=2761955 RepID=A0A8J7LRB2_9RHOB|nr:helix-turn-helix domain-containing protein [Paenihalocynthiibacter styelae]MBI1495377.1 hypothetical protein [Paenihalocynthiibacter styelae]